MLLEVLETKRVEVTVINLNTLSLHVQQAILDMDLTADALGRAQDGVKWLEEHAPPDWRLQMISIIDGRIYSEVRMHTNILSPLSLAFRRVGSFKEFDGRVKYGALAQKFGLDVNHHAAAKKLGFLEKKHQVSEVIISDEIDCHFLDKAWETVLSTLEWRSPPTASYSTTARVWTEKPDEKPSLILRLAGKTAQNRG